MATMKYPLSLLPVLFLGACATGLPIQNYNTDPVAKEQFTLCHGYSCTQKSAAGFSEKEWTAIAAIFTKKPAKTAEAERSKIGLAIARMEQYSGPKTGTDRDLPMAKGRKEDIWQLDCIDETINTTHYLRMLHKDGLLKFHTPTEPTHRGYILDGRWPHNTAVVRETESGALWAVDSFYRANGEEPYILPRADWLAGWKPPGANQ